MSGNSEFICAYPHAFEHQRAQFHEIVDSENGLRVFRSVVQESATGTGKSVTIAAVAAHYGRQGVTTLILTNRQELVKSLFLTARAAATKAGLGVGLVWSGWRESASIESEASALSEGHAAQWLAPIVVASVQSLARQIGKIPSVGLVITDECHHEEAATWERIYRGVEAKNPEWRHVGFSATPYRTKNGRPVGLGGRFESYLTNTALDYRGGVDSGVLVPLAGVKKTWLLTDKPEALEVKADDYVMRQAVIDQLTTPGALEEIIRDIREDADTRGRVPRTLGFCCTREHAEVMAKAVTLAGFHAEFVVGDSPDRALTIARWRRGDIDILFSADLFLEGFDAPEIEAIVKLRPCKSIGRGMQMFGRGTRPDPSIRLSEVATAEGRRAAIAASRKPVCVVRDYAYNEDVTPFGPSEVGGAPSNEESGSHAPVKVGDIVESTVNGQFGPGLVTAIDGNKVTVGWSNGPTVATPANNLAPFRVVGTETEDAWRQECDRWSHGLARLLIHVDKFKTAAVPMGTIDDDGFDLGHFCHMCRKQYRGTPRGAILESLPCWPWNLLDHEWWATCKDYASFVAETGQHPRKKGTNLSAREARLGAWGSGVRTDRRAGRLAEDRIRAVEAISGWAWDVPRAARTEDGRAAMREKRFPAADIKKSASAARILSLLSVPLSGPDLLAAGVTPNAPYMKRLIAAGLVVREGRRRAYVYRRTPAGTAYLDALAEPTEQAAK